MTMSKHDVYNNSVIENFKFLKETDNIKKSYLNSIPLTRGMFLLPVSRMHLKDSNLIELLTSWRNENVHVYPTQFVATTSGTRKWMEHNLLNVLDRILFLVVDDTGQAIGHIGFNNCINSDMDFEIDNVIRGKSTEKSRGIFSEALKVMIEWARKLMTIESFSLRVMNDNYKAISFYKKNGFIEYSEIALIKTLEEGVVNYKQVINANSPDKVLLKMTLNLEESNMGSQMILTAGPSISQKEYVYAYDAVENGWNSNWSGYLSKFESEFAKYIGVKYAIATSSCTGALQIALMALDIGPGDEVIVPDQTWVATAKAVTYVGATPIFADIEFDTWSLSGVSVESLITSRTKAIIPVHMYGHPTRMDEIVDLATKYNLKIVEDAAPAIGAEWKGKRCGSFGHFAGFSFQGAKLMVTGEGGMLVTNDKVLYERAYKISDQGRNPSKVFWIDEKGVKFKMSNVQAAVGLAQLERINELIEFKRRIFSWYKEGLKDIPYISLNEEVEHARSIYWMSSILLNKTSPISRNDLIIALSRMNIDSRPVFPAISQYPIWAEKNDAQPIAKFIGDNGINLPSGVCLKREEVQYICKQIRIIFSA